MEVEYVLQLKLMNAYFNATFTLYVPMRKVCKQFKIY